MLVSIDVLQMALLIIDTFLALCGFILFFIYLIRSLVRSRAGNVTSSRRDRLNIRVFALSIGLLGIGYLLFWAAGTLTNQSILGEVGYFFLDILILVVCSTILKYT